MSIPTRIWNELELSIKDKVSKIRAKLRQNWPKNPPKSDIPHQYPSMKPKNTIANLVNSIADMELSDSEDHTDDDQMFNTDTYMVKQRIFRDPPSDIIDVKAHFEYGDTQVFKDSVMQFLMEEQIPVFLEN